MSILSGSRALSKVSCQQKREAKCTPLSPSMSNGLNLRDPAWSKGEKWWKRIYRNVLVGTLYLIHGVVCASTRRIRLAHLLSYALNCYFSSFFSKTKWCPSIGSVSLASPVLTGYINYVISSLNISVFEPTKCVIEGSVRRRLKEKPRKSFDTKGLYSSTKVFQHQLCLYAK